MPLTDWLPIPSNISISLSWWVINNIILPQAELLTLYLTLAGRHHYNVAAECPRAARAPCDDVVTGCPHLTAWAILYDQPELEAVALLGHPLLLQVV